MPTDRFTQTTRNRTGNSLKGAAQYLKQPGMISLGGGLPSSEYFPFDEISIRVPATGHFSEQATHDAGTLLSAGKFDLEQGKSAYDIKVALNYGQGTGSAQLTRFVVEHTELVHDPPYRDWTCALTVGSTSAMDMVQRMFCEQGEYVLTESYSFAAAVEAFRQNGSRVLGVDMDEEGMLPDALDALLTGWDVVARGAGKPFLVYTVPSGQNPTGATQSLSRRKALYRVAQKHDLILLEDEPYYFLQMPVYTADSCSADSPVATTHEQFLSSLIPSLLSLDTDGRVIRIDSFSKVIAPGSRCGWLTASSQIIERYGKHADLSTSGPSGMTQLILFKLLDEHWGHAGYLDWLMHLRNEYTRRRGVMLGACETHLPRAVVAWRAPMAGMFHWLEVRVDKHPLFGRKSVEEIEERVFQASIAKGALVMKGSWFYADNETVHGTMFFRATFAAAPFEMIDEGIRRFGEALREEFGLTD